MKEKFLKWWYKPLSSKHLLIISIAVYFFTLLDLLSATINFYIGHAGFGIADGVIGLLTLLIAIADTLSYKQAKKEGR